MGISFEIVKEAPAREKVQRKGAGDENRAFLNSLKMGQIAKIDPSAANKSARGVLGGLSRAARESNIEIDAYTVGTFVYVQRKS